MTKKTTRKTKPAKDESASKGNAASRTGAPPKRAETELPAPESFSPTLGELDLYLFGAGKHERIYEKLGAHPMIHEGIPGVAFAVWAPSASHVSVVGNFNSWNGGTHHMRRLATSGVWELFIPGLAAGELYKYEIKSPGLAPFHKADPYAFYAEEPPDTSSIVYESKYRFRDQAWMAKRARLTSLDLRLMQ